MTPIPTSDMSIAEVPDVDETNASALFRIFGAAKADAPCVRPRAPQAIPPVSVTPSDALSARVKVSETSRTCASAAAVARSATKVSDPTT